MRNYSRHINTHTHTYTSIRQWNQILSFLYFFCCSGCSSFSSKRFFYKVNTFHYAYTCSIIVHVIFLIKMSNSVSSVNWKWPQKVSLFVLFLVFNKIEYNLDSCPLSKDLLMDLHTRNVLSTITKQWMVIWKNSSEIKDKCSAFSFSNKSFVCVVFVSLCIFRCRDKWKEWVVFLCGAIVSNGQQFKHDRHSIVRKCNWQFIYGCPSEMGFWTSGKIERSFKTSRAFFGNLSFFFSQIKFSLSFRVFCRCLFDVFLF